MKTFDGKTFKLKSGYSIPAIGFGTWQSGPNEVKEAVKAALDCGYRHIDCAANYHNEEEVGDGIKASGVPREEIFITGKLWNTWHDPENVEAAVDKTLKELQTDYLDLYLIHWPVAFRHAGPVDRPLRADGYVDVIDVPLEDTWAAMEALVAKGKIRTIGVSNFTREKIEALQKVAKIPPAVLQIEAHPYLQQRDLVEWCKQQEIVVTGYSPLGNNIFNIPKVVDDPIVISTAQNLKITPAQLLLSWAIQRGTVVLTKSVTPSRIASNFQTVAFELPSEAFEAIQGLERHLRMNFPSHLGVDIFGEKGEESVKQSAAAWVAAQKK